MLPESKLKSPFSLSELHDLFEKQRDKIEFEIEKKTREPSGKTWRLNISGERIDESYFEIWKDDYILHVHMNTNDGGHGRGINRQATFDDFKSMLFEEFRLTEPAQMTFF